MIFYFLILITFAGTPPTIENGSISLTTTAPAATIEPVPILTPSKILTPAPIHTSSSITIPFAVPPCCLIGIETESNLCIVATIDEFVATLT